MYAFMNNKAKADIVTIKFTNTVAANTYNDMYAVNISSYIDDANNYVVISAGEYIKRDGKTDTSNDIERWIYNNVNFTTDSNGLLRAIRIFPTVKVYNDSTTRKIQYTLFNSTAYSRNVDFIVVLMRKGDVVTG